MKRTIEQIAESAGVSNNQAKRMAKRKKEAGMFESVKRGTVAGTGKKCKAVKK